MAGFGPVVSVVTHLVGVHVATVDVDEAVVSLQAGGRVALHGPAQLAHRAALVVVERAAGGALSQAARRALPQRAARLGAPNDGPGEPVARLPPRSPEHQLVLGGRHVRQQAEPQTHAKHDGLLPAGANTRSEQPPNCH